MKNNQTYAISLVLLGLAVQFANAHPLNLKYGSSFDDPFAPTVMSIFGDSTNTPFSTSSNAVIGYGYFADGFDIQTNADQLIAGNLSIDNFFTNFTEIDTDSFANSHGSYAGFFEVEAGSSIDDNGGAGKAGYLITLAGAGVSDWSSGTTSATEIGIFRNTAWSAIPTDAGPLSEDHLISSITYDSIIAGGEETMANYVATVTANMFTTQAIGAAVPEPSTYALLLGAASFGFVYYRRKVGAKKGQTDGTEAEATA
jgi:hypothetical protein